jgi:O-methyltransferase involved in polyketide biosynthesis
MGFLLYVPESGVHKFLDKVNELSAPGSLYTSDMMRVKEDPKGSDLFMRVLRENGSPAEFLPESPKGNLRLI